MIEPYTVSAYVIKTVQIKPILHFCCCCKNHQNQHPNPPDDTHMFVNHSGLEVNLVEMVGKSLGYTHGFSNSADQQWGAITDGEWNGMVKMVMEDKADFMISAVGRFLFRRKVRQCFLPPKFNFAVPLCNAMALERWKKQREGVCFFQKKYSNQRSSQAFAALGLAFLTL